MRTRSRLRAACCGTRAGLGMRLLLSAHRWMHHHNICGPSRMRPGVFSRKWIWPSLHHAADRSPPGHSRSACIHRVDGCGVRERAVTLRGGQHYIERPLGARDHLFRCKWGIVRADAHQQAAEVAETHNRSFSAALPLPGFCRSFTSQQAPPLQPNRMIERLALVVSGRCAKRLLQ